MGREERGHGFDTEPGRRRPPFPPCASAVENGVLTCGVSAIRANPPYGYLCEVKVPVRGLRRHSERRVDVITSWELLAADAAPRLVTAYIKG